MLLALLLAQAEPPVEKRPAIVIEKKEAAYSYEYAWSKEAKAIPALGRKLRAQAAKDGKTFASEASEQKADSDKDGGWFPEAGYQSTWFYETAGQSAALLSLSGQWYSFTGGAHGNYGALTLLWDRRANKGVEFDSLFLKVNELARIHPQMCAALNAERAKKREGDPKVESGYDSIDQAFNGCPKMEEMTLWPADGDKDGKFDRLDVSIDPYVAGPYSEGSYEFSLPVSKRLIASLKPAYRASFEVQGRQ